jgi:hypothetical protein
MTAPEKKPLRVIDWVAIRKAYEEGDEPLRIIAAQHDISQGMINYRLAKEGWPMRRDRQRAPAEPEADPQQEDDADWAEVRREYEEGKYSVKEVCVRQGISQSRLYQRRNLENWKARCPGHPKAYGAGRTVNAPQRLKALVARKLAALEARPEFDEKIDVGDPLKGLHTLASAYEKMLGIEAREKLRDDGDRTGRLVIDDASREALAQRLEALADSWENAGSSHRA